MATYVLDTGIILGYLKGSGYAQYLEREYSISSPPNIPLISVISLGEIWSLALQLHWGDVKRKQLRDLLRTLPKVDINNEQLIERYADIDSYSLGKNSVHPLPSGMSAHTMGKNDIWIAATGSIIGATLLTTDKDFDHLKDVFLSVMYIDQSLNWTFAVKCLLYIIY